MRTITLAMIGCGTVGGGVAQKLADHADHLRAQAGADLRLKWVVVRDPQKKRDVRLPNGATLTSDIQAIINDPEVEIGVELMGGVQPAYEAISGLLQAGKHVVTANKAVLAERGRELFALAHEKGRSIAFEASVAGGIPIIAAVSESLAGNQIQSIAGILNGTSNFILTAMRQRNLDYAAALAEAQARGFAEADPTLDVDGTDAAQKLAILARLAFQSAIDAGAIYRRGIDELNGDDVRYATELGYVIKLLALARRVEDRLCLRVAPALVSQSHALATVPGEYNAIQVIGDAVGDVFFLGRGAGRLPTASSVLAGILDLATGRAQQTFQALRLWEARPPGPRFDPELYVESRFYLHFTIRDQPGTLAQIAGVLGRHGISIASVIQHETREDDIGGKAPLIFMTHMADERAVRAAIREADQMPIVLEKTTFLHVAD